MTLPCLMFDLDGTLSDPAEGIWHCFNHALAHHGLPELSREEIGMFIGPPLDESFGCLAKTSDVGVIRSLVDRYRERYAESGYAENLLYPGIAEALEFLHKTGLVIGLCTSKRTDFAETILELFRIDHYFSFVSGGDVGIKKAQQIERLLAEGTIGGNTIMIGDRAVDLIAARRNGIRAGGVLWGYGSDEELNTQNPDYLFDNPADLCVLAQAFS